jgi:hypothetical protein
MVLKPLLPSVDGQSMKHHQSVAQFPSNARFIRWWLSLKLVQFWAFKNRGVLFYLEEIIKIPRHFYPHPSIMSLLLPHHHVSRITSNFKSTMNLKLWKIDWWYQTSKQQISLRVTPLNYSWKKFHSPPKKVNGSAFRQKRNCTMKTFTSIFTPWAFPLRRRRRRWIN